MKITTSYIKNQISVWLGKSELKRDISNQYLYRHHGGPADKKDVERMAAALEMPVGASEEQVVDKLWEQWLDGKQWVREEKTKLDDWEDYISPGRTAGSFEFMDDFAQGYDQDLVEKYGSRPDLAEKCWLRTFTPKGYLGNNFRLEVVTTPEDDEVIGWVVIVD
jgi:hypothetical protein